MKLIIAIVHDDFIKEVTKGLMEKKYRTTKLSSTGGFLKAGNTTILMGVEDDKIDEVMDIIKGICSTRNVTKGKNKLKVSGANLFIMDMEDYKKI